MGCGCGKSNNKKVSGSGKQSTVRTNRAAKIKSAFKRPKK